MALTYRKSHKFVSSRSQSTVHRHRRCRRSFDDYDDDDDDEVCLFFAYFFATYMGT